MHSITEESLRLVENMFSVLLKDGLKTNDVMLALSLDCSGIIFVVGAWNGENPEHVRKKPHRRHGGDVKTESRGLPYYTI